MPIRPESGEDYDSWMERCQDEAGLDGDACDLLWERYGDDMKAGGAPPVARATGLPALALALEGSLWLAEPARLRQLAARVLAQPACPTARQVVLARKAALEEARRAPARALLSTGVDDPAELRLGNPAGGIRAVKGKVGVVAAHGPLQQRRTAELMKAGGTATEEISAALDALLADPAVGAVVLHVDSPGGESYGLEEISDKVYAARSRKPVYSIADSLAASAGFWLSTSAGVSVATPGADLGSVGVFIMHVDESQAAAAAGQQVSLVSAGRFKTEGHPFAPLTDEARTSLQAQVDHTYGKFLGALKRNRNTTLEDVRQNYGQGRILNADQALAAGAIDRILSMEDLLRKLTGGGGSVARAASAEMLRLRHDQRKRASAL